MEEFEIDVDEAVLTDLRDRLRRTRWPEPAPGEPWSQGTDEAYLRELLAYWADGYDWRAQERDLNRFAHFRTTLDDTQVHFVHARAEGGGGIPLVLTSGWPSTFAELLPLVPLLTDPAAHGIDGPAFDLVLPSLPGYGFSPRPPRTGITYRYVAGLWHRLMRELGYERYAAGGSDFGAGVATYMGLDDPAPLIGLHLSTPEIPPYTGPGSRPLSDAERAYREGFARWSLTERGYQQIQSTRPQTLGYGLADSPAGLAAWILEKWRAWSDPARAIDRDLLLTTVTLYWVTGTITSSMRDYFDNRWFREPLGPDDFVDVPTGFAKFDHHLADEGDIPREWLERLFAIRRWTPMPRGGHFAAAEAPALLAADIAAFFGSLSTP
ncbi:epoxide hydrolase [Phytohabitans sp. ZYX-F-186]|uniref:Epoxide hydrolase n=1 Tax=Phytohabitans maris TaxID=3071409 RepID=A0ABU0ZSG4_9ACTN|nr:epoxide hydrolase [Phytohabitans sp. ZYX-F-186]MDQ7909264.1 epoxide hydrolase [Phytohabitans sp. ZYX-F-186]